MTLNRRGNALILVAAVLVLLVIIATVFLSRTATLRQVSASQRQAAFQTDRMESAAKEIAQEIATALFTHPIDYTDAEYLAGLPVDEGRRKRPAPDAVRYGVDERFTWNRAPYEVSPWTNPPDWLSWPLRPGPWRALHDEENIGWNQRDWNWHEYRSGEVIDLFHWPLDPMGWPFHATETVLPLRQNPIGGPGISDTRWLRDIEPQRMASESLHNALDPFDEFVANPFNDRFLDGFSHWRHLSYIGRPQNGWRMCPDIADVTGIRSSMTPDGIRYHADQGWIDGRRYYGGILNRLDLPIEQWPATLPSRGMALNPNTPFERLTDENTADGDTATSMFVFDDELLTIPPLADPDDFPSVVSNAVVWDFWDRWLAWLRPEGQRLAIQASEQGVGGSLPPNFYDLSDLDGDGVHGEIFDPDSVPGPNNPNPTPPRWGERPEDEFTPGTARWNVSRILTDTDGDGFTDSFWWLSPHIGVDGTRQVIGVSITDNTGRLNANAATRFIRNDQAAIKESSRGATPGDLALVGQNYGVTVNADDYGNSNFAPQAPVWNTGFFDIEAHQPYLYEVGTTYQMTHPALTVPLITFPEAGRMTGDFSEVYAAWDPDFWREYNANTFNSRALVDQLNLRLSPILPDDIADANDRENRLAYFQMSGQDPQHPQNVFTPFNLADELELRASEGANHPWIDSQFERATGLGTNQYGNPNDVNLLRGLTIRNETSESADQLDNRQHSFDLRHRMTFFSGARNESLPPHLWWENRAPLPRANGIVYGNAMVPTSIYDPIVEDLQDRFAEQMRLKLDLREYERPVPSMVAMQAEYAAQPFSERLAHALLLGLTSGKVTDRDYFDVFLNAVVAGNRDSYFGKGDAAWERTRRMAAAMAANMLAARDTDDDSPLYTMEGYHPLVATDVDVPTRGWFGETGAVPLPIFEEPYHPEDVADPAYAGDLITLDDNEWESDGSPVVDPPATSTTNDFIDLSDATLRNPSPDVPPGSGGSPALPWGSYMKEFEGGDPDNPSVWTEDRLLAEHESWTASYSPEIHMLGVEPQPFIAEAFLAVVGRPWRIPGPPEDSGGGGGQPGGGGDGGQPPPRYKNAGEWIWATVSNSDMAEYGEVLNAVGNDQYWVDASPPQPPRVVFAVQLLNPYDVPLPLLDRDGSPIYTLRFFRTNRLQPDSPYQWEIPLDPTGTNLNFTAGTPTGQIDLSASVAGPMIPPATNDRPYSLMIVMNGVEAMGGTEAYEANRWLDFIDAEPAMHPSGDAFEDKRYPDLDRRTIESGELIWMLDPDTSNVDNPAQSLPSLAGAWYAPGVGGGGATHFTGPPINPRHGTAIELVRHHRRDWGDDGYGSPDADPKTLDEDYQANVVIDRTVGPDGVDEFAHVLTTQLALHRQPLLHDMSGGVGSIEELVDTDIFPIFPMEAAVTYAIDPEIPDGGELPTGLTRSGSDLTVKQSWQYPRLLGYGSIDEPLEDNRDEMQGQSNLEFRYRIPPEKARWVQWARYSRSWAVDDWSNDPSLSGSPPDPPTPEEAEYATKLNLSNGLPTAARRWRPDRAAPRFVASDARVTRSWSRPWAVRLGTMPDLDPALAFPPQNPDGSPVHEGEGTSFPYHAFPIHADAGRERVLQTTTWAWDGESDSVGPETSPNSQKFLGLVAGEDPLLTDQNLPPMTSVAPTFSALTLSPSPLRLDRRYAEQKASFPPQGADEALDPDGGSNYRWSRWTVATLPDSGSQSVTRDVRVLVVGDPELDDNLPFSASLMNNGIGDLAYPSPYANMADWGVAWFSEHEDYGENEGYAAEAADTYASLIRFRHGNIYHVDWDPDGLGRIDTGGDGDYDSVAVAYTSDNPYPYPWSTRNVRLPWQFDVGDLNEPSAEYRIFQAEKPCFFAMTPRRNLNGSIVAQDIGYDGDNSTYDWSYPDKGWYGPQEIDGDILMPHGFQVNLKNANYEQIGEVLNSLTVAHELYLPLKPAANVGATGLFPGTWYMWPPEPQVKWDDAFDNHPVGGTDGIATLRTFSEGLSDQLAAGVRVGRMQLSGAAAGLNAIIGDQPYVLTDLDLEDPENAPPPWYLASDDPAHFEPDLPASQRIADLFVCDGPGIWDLETNQDNDTHNQGELFPDGFIDDRGSYARFTSTFGGVSNSMPRNPAFDNAAGFRGDPTRGLININTAPVEVLRAMPHMYRLVHADPSFGGHPSILDDDVTSHDLTGPISPHPRSGVPEALVQYRDGLGKRPAFLLDHQLDMMVPGTAAGPLYADRGSGENSLSIDDWYDHWYDQWSQNSMDLDTDQAIQYARGGRGFAATGELFQLSRPALYGFEMDPNWGDKRDPLGSTMSADAWRMDWAARNPFGYQDEQVHGVNSAASRMWDARDELLLPEHRRALADVGAFLSTDTGRLYDSQVPDLRTAEYVASGTWGNPIDNDPLLSINASEPRYEEVHLTGDRVAGDAEESNLLFSGISNLITTRSDMFTVHLRVRTFKQDPETGVWDATDPKAIVADQRFVMVVDRSNVERPGDRPRILLMDRVDH